jgi:NADPH:quinone reductase-like Zn-dependent oxidoreductase
MGMTRPKNKNMKAITYHQFGSADVLKLEEVAAPVAPANGVVVTMRASSVNIIDSRSRNGLMSPFVNKKFPKIPGADVAGVVSAVGANAKRFKVGDKVFGATNAFKGGAFAERVALTENQLAPLPPSLTFEQAAALPITGLAALLALRGLGKTKPGDEVLIYGSSGAAGLYAIQLAKHFGAHVTTVSGRAGAKVSKEMGADVALDYKAGPVKFAGRFDVIVDFSSQFPFAKARPHLKLTGRFIESSPTIPKFLGSLIANLFRAQKHLMLTAAAKTSELEFLSSLVEAGKLKVTIAKTYPLAAAKPAFLEQEKGGTVGKIVVSVA